MSCLKVFPRQFGSLSSLSPTKRVKKRSFAEGVLCQPPYKLAVERDRVCFSDHGMFLQIGKEEPVLPPSERAPIVAGVMAGIKRSIWESPQMVEILGDLSSYKRFIALAEEATKRGFPIAENVESSIRNLVQSVYGNLFYRGFLVDGEVYYHGDLMPVSSDSLQHRLFMFNWAAPINVFPLVAGSLDQRGLGLSDRLWLKLFPSLDPGGAQSYIRN